MKNLAKTITAEEIRMIEEVKNFELKASSLPLGKSIRATAEDISYWLFDIAGIKYVGYYVGDKDCPQKSFFKHKTEFRTNTRSSSEIILQRL